MLRKSLLFTATLLAGTSLYAQKNVSVNFTHEYDGEPFAFNQDFTDWAGRTMQWTRAEMYLSEVELVHDGGQTIDLSSEYLLVRTTNTSYPLGMHNINTLEDINFSVGVDTSVNHLDPTLYPATHPLAMQNPTMHWGWAGGYRFLILHGIVDVDGDNVPETPFELQAIGDATLTPVTVSTAGHDEGNNLEIWINIDYSGWLENINLNAIGSIHGEMAPIPEMMTNTADYNVFSAPLNIGIGDDHVVPSFVYVDYTYAMSPQLNYHMNSSDKVSIMVTDMTGKIVAQKDGMPAEGSYTIQEGLATGIYSATFFSGDTYLKSEKVRVVR